MANDNDSLGVTLNVGLFSSIDANRSELLIFNAGSDSFERNVWVVGGTVGGLALLFLLFMSLSTDFLPSSDEREDGRSRSADCRLDSVEERECLSACFAGKDFRGEVGDAGDDTNETFLFTGDFTDCASSGREDGVVDGEVTVFACRSVEGAGGTRGWESEGGKGDRGERRCEGVTGG